MIIEYHRPRTLKEALDLLERKKPMTYPMGGGTILSQPSDYSFAVVDLQALELDRIHKVGNKLEIGASVTLSRLLESSHIYPALASALRLEAPLNLRNMATIAGALVACDGRSPFATAMLALDAKLIVAPNDEQLMLGNFLPLRARAKASSPEEQRSPLYGKLITKIEIPSNLKLAFETVARTPADKPILCAALAQWPSGRTRLALGGWGSSPVLAMDGNEPSGLEAAARNATSEAGDEWASAEYRIDIAAVLGKRCLAKLED